MVGREYPSEIRSYQDAKTGVTVRQLTGDGSNNYHLYFTDNSFTLGDREIYFLSDRGSRQPELFNYFRMDLQSGLITQLTAESNGISKPTKSPDSRLLIYETDNRIKKLDPRTGATEIIYETNDDYQLGMPFISPDQKYLGFARNENVRIDDGPNYQGFKERFYAIKRGWITLVELASGRVFDVFEDTHQLGHFQFSPLDPTLATFCHEGPWHLVTQRIWLLDLISRSVKPCFRQGEDDCIGHEFWTRDGNIFFDNRRKGHDGTITSSKTQATVGETLTDQIPYVGLADPSGELIRSIDLPFYCNHLHANNDNTLLVGDEVEDLVLIDIRRDQPQLKTLCTHHTSWYLQRTHCHPTFSWGCGQILYTSDRDGQCNVYTVDPEQVTW